MSRRKAVLAVAVVLALAAGVAGGAWAVRSLPPKAEAAATPSPMTPVRTVAVARKTLQVQASLPGTLAYSGSYDISGRIAGTLTWAPEPGTVIGRGGELFEIDGGQRKTILLFGDRPAWRNLFPGRPDGADIGQLERNLEALGYTGAETTIDDHWDANTTAAVKRWQQALGIPVDGTIEVGEIVFLPGPFRVASVAPLGTPTAGGELLHGTTNTRVVSLSLEATRRGLLSLGQAVTVMLPDGSTTPAKVTEIGRVAHSSGGDTPGLGSGAGSTPTLDVTISLDDAAAAPDLDQAPVTVRVVTSARQNVLAVPVNALVALLEGGYAVEVAAADGSRRYVAVELGLFDSGWVELTSGDVHEGDRVVVPA